MMKKFLAVFMILAMLTAVPASASSLFPTIPTVLIEEAPSYGVFADTEPMMEEVLEDGSVRNTYGGVTQDTFNAYGVVLNERSYTLPSYEYVGNSLVASVVKDGISFQVVFDWEAGTLAETYPANVKYEQRVPENPFAGYVSVELGQTVKFKELVQTTLNSFSSVGHECGYDCTVGLITNCKIISTTGRRTNNIFTSKENNNGVISATLHFINEDGHYKWPSVHTGTPEYYRYGPSYIKGKTLASMESESVYVCFTAPASAYKATDGILAITLEKGDEKYVIYLRGGEE